MGILFVLSGARFLAGVLDPPILPTWGSSEAAVIATASAHRAAWFASAWLITLSIVAGLAAVELLARTLDSDLARVGRSLYMAGSVLGLASTTYDLAVTSTLLGASPPVGLVPRRPALGRRTRHRLLRPAGTGCDRLPRSGDPAYPRAACVDGLRSPDRRSPASQPVRRIPWCATVPAVPGLHHDRHRSNSPQDATSTTITDRRTCPPDRARAAPTLPGSAMTGWCYRISTQLLPELPKAARQRRALWRSGA